MSEFITRKVVAAQIAANDETGATAVEYGIMVAGIAALVMATVWILGGQIDGLFGDVSDQIGGA